MATPLHHLRSLLALVIALSFATTPHAQTTHTSQNLSVLATNTLFHGLASGTGALLNAERDGRSGWQTFSRGFALGAAGGVVMHGGRMLSHQVQTQRNLAWSWPARLVNAAGASLAENAAYGRRPLSHFHMLAWGLRLDYDLPGHRFQTRITPAGIGGFLVVQSPDHRLNLRRSLASGYQWFDLRPGSFYAQDGRNFAMAIAAGVDARLYGAEGAETEYWALAAHEVAHGLAYESYVHFNPLLEPVVAEHLRGRKWWDVLARFVYLDLNGPYHYCMYHAMGGRPAAGCYWDNRHERNTELFSTRARVTCR